jgi:hypothetical protein
MLLKVVKVTKGLYSDTDTISLALFETYVMQRQDEI